MSGVGEEASGVGEHSHESGEVSEVCKGDHLILHAGLVIVEPPCAALLNLGHCGRILEAAENGADSLVVVGIQAVQNGPGQLVGLNQRIQEVCHLSGRSIVVDAVITGIGTELLIHLCIVVSLTAIVKLHCPI